MQEAIRWSLLAGLEQLELAVHTTNFRALSVYLRCGFEAEGLRRSSLLVDGKYVNEYHMSLSRGVNSPIERTTGGKPAFAP